MFKKYIKTIFTGDIARGCALIIQTLVLFSSKNQINFDIVYGAVVVFVFVFDDAALFAVFAVGRCNVYVRS